MTDDQVRGGCPWCLRGNMTETPVELEGGFVAHESCAKRFSEALSSTGKRDPALMMSVMSFVGEHRSTDPAWGRRAFRMLRGEEPVPPIDIGS